MQKRKKRLNDLDGRTWTRFSISVWNDIYKNAPERRLKHPALFPVTLVERLLQIFAPKGAMILDPFLGSGSTLVGAQRLGMRGLGLEISAEYLQLFQRRLQEEKIAAEKTESSPGPVLVQAINDDARNLLKYAAPLTVDLCLTSPPYWNILQEKRSADRKPLRNYGDASNDLGNIGSYELFLDELEEIFAQVYTALKNGSYCLVVVMDIRKKNIFYPLHMDLSRRMISLGFIFDDLIIWDRRQEYNNLRPLGYPYVFRVNKVHEFILIFQKPLEPTAPASKSKGLPGNT